MSATLSTTIVPPSQKGLVSASLRLLDINDEAAQLEKHYASWKENVMKKDYLWPAVKAVFAESPELLQNLYNVVMLKAQPTGGVINVETTDFLEDFIVLLENSEQFAAFVNAPKDFNNFVTQQLQLPLYLQSQDNSVRELFQRFVLTMEDKCPNSIDSLVTLIQSHLDSPGMTTGRSTYASMIQDLLELKKQHKRLLVAKGVVKAGVVLSMDDRISALRARDDLRNAEKGLLHVLEAAYNERSRGHTIQEINAIFADTIVKKQELVDMYEPFVQQAINTIKSTQKHASQPDLVKLQVDTFNVTLDLYRLLSSFNSFRVNLSYAIPYLFWQLLEIVEKAVSIAFCGLLKAGKSSVVDTLVGDDLSAKRQTAMTAIPVRFVHDLAQKTPVLVVPFASELNNLTKSIRLMGLTEGMLTGMMANPEYNQLIRMICTDDPTVTFQSIYEGADVIRKVSPLIHDTFRIAAKLDEDVQSELTGILTSIISWNNAESLMTVYKCFNSVPGVQIPPNFTIIDTPGIDEAGVTRLDLYEMLNNTITVSNVVAVVMDISNYTNVTLGDFLHNLSTNVASSNTPVTTLMNKIDVLMRDFDDPKVVEEKLGEVRAFFARCDFKGRDEWTFFVSAKHKEIAAKAHQQLLLTNGEFIPSADVMTDYISVNKYKLKEYNDLSRTDIEDDINTLNDMSRMSGPLDMLFSAASEHAIPVTTAAVSERVYSKTLQIIETIQEIYDEQVGDVTEASTALVLAQQVAASVVMSAAKLLKEKKEDAVTLWRAVLLGEQNQALVKLQNIIAEAAATVTSTSPEYLKLLGDQHKNHKFSTAEEAESVLDQLRKYFADEVNKLCKEIEKRVKQSLKDLENKLHRITQDIEANLAHEGSKLAGSPVLARLFLKSSFSTEQTSATQPHARKINLAKPKVAFQTVTTNKVLFRPKHKVAELMETFRTDSTGISTTRLRKALMQKAQSRLEKIVNRNVDLAEEMFQPLEKFVGDFQDFLLNAQQTLTLHLLQLEQAVESPALTLVPFKALEGSLEQISETAKAVFEETHQRRDRAIGGAPAS